MGDFGSWEIYAHIEPPTQSLTFHFSLNSTGNPSHTIPTWLHVENVLIMQAPQPKKSKFWRKILAHYVESHQSTEST